MKTIDIFIKTYHRDFKWLKYALESIKRNVFQYNNLILLVPEHEKHLFDTRELPKRTMLFYVKERGNGYLFQQWCKLSAYKYSSADFIMMSDSDCIFTRAIYLQDYIRDDKPQILYTSWEKVGDAVCWREPTEKIIGEEVPWETMRRNCLIYHRSTLGNLSIWKPDLENIVMNSERFSEFNLIGSYAYKFEQEKYKFVNTDDWTYVPPLAEQLWSHASKNENAKELHLREYIRALEVIMEANDVEPPKDSQ